MKLLVPILIAVAIIAIGFAVALTTRGNARTARRTSRSKQLEVALSPDETLARLKAMPAGKYRVDDSDPHAKVVVLSSNPTGFTWGFLYPVFITARPDGGSRIDIGIKSRFLQFGPLVTRAHEEVTDALDAHLS